MSKRYKKNTSGHIMVTDYFTTHPEYTIRKVLNDLSYKKGNYRFMDYGYIIDKNSELIGVFSICDLFRYSDDTPINCIIKEHPIHTVSPHSKAEYAAHIAVRNKIKALPVVEKGKLLGIIPSKKILSVLNRSSQEDFMHMAGVSQSHLDYDDTMKVPTHISVWHRAPWLLIGLIGIIFAAGFIGLFEKALEQYMILAFFIPVIVYLSGALGSQHITICVRDLASHGKELNHLKYFLKQSSIAF
jgi:magnesium transporter